MIAADGDFDSASIMSALALYSWAMTINRLDTSSSDAISGDKPTSACVYP
jgi:hypothetical protein